RGLKKYRFTDHSYFVMYIFFFFQAEDGIRDSSVTGVQTCALPISSRASPGTPRAGRCGGTKRPRNGLAMIFQISRPTPNRKITRSEERRVGKECRSRWSQCQ